MDAPVGSVDVTFNLPTGPYTVSSSKFIVNSGWDPNTLNGDIAIIVLPGPAPVAAERYQLYTGNQPLDQVITVVGYGATGTGLTGQTGPAGVKHSIENMYEVYGQQFDGIPWTPCRSPRRER